MRIVHVRSALDLAAAYWTKESPFAGILSAVGEVLAGRQSFCPAVQQHLVVTPRGLRYDPPPHRSSLALLTARELQVLGLLAQGLTLKQCAQHLGLAGNTVENHKTRAMKKLGIHKVTDLVRLALQEGLASPTL